MPMSDYFHHTVLLNQAVDALITNKDGVYVDATFGGGGHSTKILEQLSPKGKLFAFDQDDQVQHHLPKDNRFTWIKSNFRYLKKYMEFYNIEKLDGLLADLGISSHHIDAEERGFSFHSNAPLDMRMNNQQTRTAYDVWHNYNEQDLINILRDYGEITNAPTIIKKWMAEKKTRKLNTCAELANWLQPFTYGKSNKFLAQVFQALRIEVNQEMQVLDELLVQTTDLLKPEGRLVVISFHSLEDRKIKEWLKGNIADEKEKLFGIHKNRFHVLTKDPIVPDESEIKDNPRSRSAKMRVGSKNKL